ncbi:hypothetical protein [Vibrio parahaemolyticus]|uniref:hypothetical protein n=1 Tax=Vibrio parahaemolyticus TaxID=670 RepID=UPI002152A0AC|nr:hypothetical protein [Vibrio parahaemolyticus]
MEYPIQLFGYLNEQDAEPTCMVSNVTKDTVQELNQLHGFKVDDWFLSSGRCEFTVHTRQLMKLAKQQQPNTV